MNFSSLTLQYVSYYYSYFVVVADFGLVFRTFGSDSTEIAHEYNEFCRGAHSICVRPVDINRRRKADMYIDVEKSVGKITRGGIAGETETYSLQLGSFIEKPCVINGGANIYRHILSMIFDEGKRALILQDDYPYWHACGETDHSGKLFLIDPTTENISIVQIFFDDNVERDRAHIIDVRTLPSLDRVSFDEANDRLYMRVSPYDIIMDCNYYIDSFDAILSRRNILS